MKQVHNTGASEKLVPAKIAVSLTSCLCTVDALFDWPDGVLPSGQRRLLSGMRYSTAGIFPAHSAYPGVH